MGRANLLWKSLGIFAITGMFLFLGVSCIAEIPQLVSVPTNPDTEGREEEQVTSLGRVTSINIDEIESTSFMVQWVAPSNKGTKKDGAKLGADELIYHVYYVARDLGQTVQVVPSAATIKQEAKNNVPLQVLDVRGSTSIRITDLGANTRYFVVVETHNSFMDLKNLSNEVVEANTFVLDLDLDGRLTYEKTEFEFFMNDMPATINPLTIPATNGILVRYVIERRDAVSDSAVRIDEHTGVIAVDPVFANLGTIKYLVRAIPIRDNAQAIRYNVQNVEMVIRVIPRVMGKVSNAAIDTIEDTSFVVSWTPPAERGIKEDGTSPDLNELMYRVHYVERTFDQEKPSAELLRQESSVANPPQVQDVIGVANARIIGLRAETRYFVAVETYDIFTGVFLLSSDDEVVEVTTTELTGQDFDGRLTYAETEYKFFINDPVETISPDTVPTAVDDPQVRYSLEKRDGVTFTPETAIRIDENTGVITINPTTKNVGVARFWVLSKATGYNTQYITLTIGIVPQVVVPVTHIIIDAIEDTSFRVLWNAPEEPGTKLNGEALGFDEIVYRVYYIERETGQRAPSAESVRQEASVAIPVQVQEVTGSTNIKVIDLKAKTRYLVVVETHNPFVQASVLSDEVVDASTKAELEGKLQYADTELVFSFSGENDLLSGGADEFITKDPISTPTSPNGEQIFYSLERIDGVDFIPNIAVRVDESNGSLIIGHPTNGGTARYLVSATANGYGAKSVEITIHINIDFKRGFEYAETEYSFYIGDVSTTVTVVPASIPSTIVGGSTRYVVEKEEGADFADDMVRIDEGTGVITVDPANTNVVGTASYYARVMADGYNTQEVMITIDVTTLRIINRAYHSGAEVAEDSPVIIGQGLRDSVLANTAVLTLHGIPKREYVIHSGASTNQYNGATFKMTGNDTETLIMNGETLKSKLPSIRDGSVIGISGPGIIGIKLLATFRPLEIYGWQDLQAMRINVNGDYVLKKDIVFPSSYEFVPVGKVGKDGPFTGSIDGTKNETEKYSITGLRQTGYNYQGLFGIMRGHGEDAVVAKNLILRDFVIGGASISAGALTGAMTRGVVKSVEVLDATVTGNIFIGGLAGSNQGTIIGSFSTGFVSGSGAIGGLVGVNQGFVAGYSTADVNSTGRSGNEYSNLRNRGGNRGGTGGLVGDNSTGGTTIGYATGDVSGVSGGNGGLVGRNYGDVIGYATGTVTGAYFTGGLIGFNFSGNIENTCLYSNHFCWDWVDETTSTTSVVGYSRSIINQVINTEICTYSYRPKCEADYVEYFDSFGRTLGYDETDSISYHSATSEESEIYRAVDGTASTGIDGKDGVEVDIGSVHYSEFLNTFDGFTFTQGTEIGQWFWVNNKWPALNIGMETVNTQPIDID